MIARLALAGVAVALAMPAVAGDYDQRWIDRSVQSSRAHKVSPSHRVSPPRHARPAPRRTSRPAPRRPVRKQAPRRHYYAAPEPQYQIGGIITSGRQTIQRDVLSNVVCLPALQSLSVEANTLDGAWRDAQRNWENLVRWTYGERLMSIANARNVIKRCSRSSGNQSMVGRAVENIASVAGGEGYKHRCEIIAEPCMAPAIEDAITKGDR